MKKASLDSRDTPDMPEPIVLQGDVLGLDLGKKRTGVARISVQARIPEALRAIDMDGDYLDEIASAIKEHQAEVVVAGLPRGLNGQETDQTVWAREIIAKLRGHLDVPVFTVDEALTTHVAESRANESDSVDSVAAGIIADDFVSEVLRGNIDNVSI